MKIYSAFKFVHEEQDIVVKSDRTLDLSKGCTVKVSPFDLNAIEAACELKAQVADTEVVALSVGGQLLANPKARKDVLSRGPDALLCVQDDAFEGLRPNETAKVLAATLKAKGFDLVLCGNGSGDIYAQQTGMLLGEFLGVPAINGVSKIISCDGKTLVCERGLENEVETLEVTLPAVVSVSVDINEPKIPQMRAILASAKKPVEVMDKAAVGVELGDALVKVNAVQAQPSKARAQVIVEGDDDAAVHKLVEEIRKVVAL